MTTTLTIGVPLPLYSIYSHETIAIVFARNFERFTKKDLVLDEEWLNEKKVNVTVRLKTELAGRVREAARNNRQSIIDFTSLIMGGELLG